MTKQDRKSAFWLAVLIISLVVSLTTGFLEAIIVPLGLIIFGFLALGTCYAIVFYSRKYVEDHPYIPYAGRYAHVLCRECTKAGVESRIEMDVGTAYEGWSIGGKYFRGFKRSFVVRCSRGHQWKYDPILEQNILPKKDRKPRYPKNWKKQRDLDRKMRVMLRRVWGIEPEKIDEQP